MSLAFEEAGAGKPLILLHAFPYDRAMWAPQRAGLAALMRVLTPDLPGFGQSPVVPGITIERMADAVAQFLDSLGLKEPVVLGGLSMGGYVAMAFARQYPNRVGGLILTDTRGEPDDAEGKGNRGKAMEMVRQDGAAAFIEAQIPKQFGPATLTQKPEVVAEARRIGSAQDVEGIVAALGALRDRPDALADLSRVDVPTLIVVGEEDAITPPAMSETLRTRIPGSRLVRIKNAGHMSNLEQPEAFNHAVRDFLVRFDG